MLADPMIGRSWWTKVSAARRREGRIERQRNLLPSQHQKGLRVAFAGTVGLIDAGQNLDQRRFAGSILADERVNLTGRNIQVNAIKDTAATERLRHIAQ